MQNARLNRMKWLTVGMVIAFSVAFEYVRHVAWPQLLHTSWAYFGSLAFVLVLIVVFNQIVFRAMARLQRDLAQQTRYLNLLIESSGNAIITSNRDGTITSWNHAAEVIYGWPKEQTVGRSMPMVPKALIDDAREILGKVWSGEMVRNLEVRRLRENGEEIPVLLTVSPMQDADGSVVGVLGISTDLRERKRLEGELVTQQRAMAVLKEREHLARELHDDLGQILGYVNTQSLAIHELLIQGKTDKADGLVNRLVQVAQDAHADVREHILSLHTNVSPEQRLIPTLRGYVRHFSQNTGIVTEITMCDDSKIDLLPTAETQVMRIVQETLTNVRKHSAATHVSINACVESGMMRLEIADDGQGFDPSRISLDGGQRFGQQIMHDRAQEIGGSVEVVSAPGQGTLVIIHAPLVRAEVPV